MSGRNRWLPYALLAPIILGMLVLVYYPILETFAYSVQAMNLTTPWIKGFVWLKNYVELLRDPSVLMATLNSVDILVLVLVETVMLGLAFALVLNRNSRVKGILTAIVIVPWALPPVVNGVIWRWVFHPDYGVVNSVLIRLGIVHSAIPWLTSHLLIINVAALVVAWRSAPLAAVIFLSALQAIPKQLYEASQIDGCGVWTQFRLITLPLLRPVLGIVLTTTSITGINVFDEVVALSGFASGTRTLMLETYLRTFRFLNFGTGSALVYLVMLGTAVIGAIYIRRVYREVEYL